MYGIWYRQIWFKCLALKTLHGIMPGLAPKMSKQLVSAVVVLSFLIYYLVHINKHMAFFGTTRPRNSTR